MLFGILLCVIEGDSVTRWVFFAFSKLQFILLSLKVGSLPTRADEVFILLPAVGVPRSRASLDLSLLGVLSDGCWAPKKWFPFRLDQWRRVGPAHRTEGTRSYLLLLVVRGAEAQRETRVRGLPLISHMVLVSSFREDWFLVHAQPPTHEERM